MFNNGQALTGFQMLETMGSEFNAQAFLIQTLLSKITTCKIVKVMGVTNDGGVTPVGFVDIHPLVTQIDGNGNAMPHGTIYGCPYFRLQGGANAIILDPKVGDIGIAVFADRDISSVIANKGDATPGSRRRFDPADGLYIGGILNGVPVQYLEFSAAGITITSPMAVTVNGQTVTVNATDASVHATNSLINQDVNGYGSKLTFTGGNNFQLDTFTTGAIVNSTEHGWTPPRIT